MRKTLIIILALTAVLVHAATPCNATHQYTLPATSACYIQCPWTAPTYYYNYPPTLTCQATCIAPYYGFTGNQTCLTTCPSSPNITYYDSVNRKCVNVCPANYYAATNRSCLQTCTSGTWGDSSTSLCVTVCPVGTFYQNVTVPLCVMTCPNNYYGSPIDRICYVGGTCPITPVRYFADDTTSLCVANCPNGYFADTTTGRCLIYCSSGFFADQASGKCLATCGTGFFRSSVTRSCVRACTQGYYADPATLNCTTYCSLNSYGDSLTNTCNKICTMPNFADPTTRLCVAICPAGYYADNFTQSCVTAPNCYSNTIGDPTTNKCVVNTACPTSPYTFADLTNKVCTTRCATTWGNTVSRQCVTTCPWDTSSYVTWANPDTRQCVTKCPTYPVLYADNQTRTCIATCPQAPTVAYNSYADPTSQSCVRDCPTGYMADPDKRQCLRSCTTLPNIQFYNPLSGQCEASCPKGYFADKSTLSCVLNCPTSPLYFSYDGNNTCLSVCPSNYFGDRSTGACVLQCPQTTLQYADSSTNLCVNQCPFIASTFGLLASDGYRRCVTTCDVGLFADPVTRTCVPACNMQLGYYGQKTSPLRTCVTECSTNKYEDNSTGLCVSTCPLYPSKTYGNPVTKMCQARCPKHLYGNNNNLCVPAINCQANTFGDNLSNLCVSLCPANQSTFGNSATKTCIQVCPEGTYADSTTRLCSTSCGVGLFKDPSTKTCTKQCPSMPNLYADTATMTCRSTCSNNNFAYDVTRVCLATCPSTPPYFGQLDTRRCVQACPRETYQFSNNTYRACVSSCPPRVYSALYSVNLYADNSTWSCVPICPAANLLYNFAHPTNTQIRQCVTTCPMVGAVFYFAQNVTQSCVLTCPSATQLTYGDIFNSICVLNCSRNQFRDNSTSRCVYQCSAGYYADNTTWNCVQTCPVGLFIETINQTCAKHCPTGYYANNVTGYCQSLCNTELYLYSDNTTWKCMRECPASPDFYADPNTKLCTLRCTGGLFADGPTRNCLPALNCSNAMVAEPISGRCTNICPIEVPSFLDDSTNLCEQVCPDGYFADNSTMECVPECPSNPDYYAYNHTTLKGLCVLFCPFVTTLYYRHTPTRECLTTCPGPEYFRDMLTMRCVTKCPAYYYAEVINQICVANCSGNSKYGYKGECYSACPNNTNADPTTFYCVQVCPFGYFAQNSVCVTNCVGGYADPFLKVCVPICTPDYFAYQPTLECRQDCQPQYKYFPDQTCIVACPTTNLTSTNLYMDDTTYSCINKCLPTWYADNTTRSCKQTCSASLYADNSTGLCVTQCPAEPDYYGYNGVCYFPCPATPTLFAQNLTRTCMTGCPSGGFADSFNWRCVAVCTGIQYGYSGGSSPVCLSICPSNWYGYNQTKLCVQVCPNGTFGENTTRLCLLSCPSGSFADSFLNLCVAICNATIPQYADDSTHTCVAVCPSSPSLYGEILVAGPKCVPACLTPGWYTLNTTRLCVTWCPPPFYADSITGDCAYFCQLNYNFYADNVSRTCASSCPNVSVGGVNTVTYADDSTKTCVWTCPFTPSLYGHNATNKCVATCPTRTYGDNDTRLCLQTCFFGVPFNGVTKYSYAENTTTFCVYQCPPGSWADNLTYQCVAICSEGYYADWSTWRCVLMCPANPISYAFKPNRTCIYACPSGYFAADVGRVCMPNSCPTVPYFYYKEYDSNQCVLKCVYPHFGEISSQSCVTTCSYGFYQNLGSMSCAACPSACLTCINSENCTTCQPRLYLYNGQCVTTCPTFPIYYYMYDPSFTCLEACPAPYFGFLANGKCEVSCPGGYFKNVTSSTCQNCPAGCNGCYGTVCSTCITGYIFVQKYATCSKMCSLVKPYFLSGKCATVCPSGTFLLDDLVTCQKCNQICAECSQVATNCTKCQGNFWYNYNCVSQCPKNYYVDQSNACQSCSSNPTICQLPPLSFTFEYKIINYQFNIIVTFNRPVNLTSAQFGKVAQLKTSKGAIKPSQYIVTHPSPTVYRVLIPDASTLNQLSLNLGFQPGSLVDSNGLGLTNIQASTTVQVVSTITPAVKAQAQKLGSNLNVVSWVLIAVIALMMIKCSYPMIVLLDLLQYIHLHLYVIVTPLPYFFMTVIQQLKNVNFAFLPALYTNPSPDSDGNYFSFQQDTTFLGNCQPFVFFLALFGLTYLIFWLLSSSCNKVKCLRRKSKAVFRSRMRFSFLHEIFYYTEYYVLFFALYQFTGANSYISASSTNLAAAVIVFLCYMVWLVAIMYLGAKYRKRLDTIPQKFRFLVYEESQFPMEIPMRASFKLIVGCVLIAGEISVQLILLMVFNLIYLIYTLCYMPSKNKLTNILNATISIGMICCEIILFTYKTSSMGATLQTTYSYALLAIMGLLVVLVITWMFYRFIKYIREEICGIKPAVEEEKPKIQSMNSKLDYEKVHVATHSKPSLRKTIPEKLTEKEKDMNISELNFQDEQEQLSDTPQVTAEEAMQMFTYHYVPKKSEGLLKHEKELMGIKEDRKAKEQVIIEIDEDELIDYNSRVDSRQSGRPLRNKSAVKKGRGRAHLRIQAEDSMQELEDIKLHMNEKQGSERERESERAKEQKSESEQSNIWTRRQRKQQAAQPQQNRVVWDHHNLPQQSEE